MRTYKFLLSILFIFLITSTISAQEKSPVELELPKIDFENLTWGWHNIPISLTNNSEFVQFVTIVTDVKCRGKELNPERKVTKNIALYSESKVETEVKLLVPGNYGDFDVSLKVYNVIDTMDFLMESRIVYQEAGSLKITVPDEIAKIINGGINLPPLVGRHIDTDNDFSRILPFLVKDGLTEQEIAEMCGTTTQFVKEEIDYLSSRGYYRREGNTIISGIAAISAEEASEEKKIAIATAGKISTRLAKNFESYRDVIDSLVEAGTLTSDTNSFLDGGTVLYFPYPVVMGLSLWFDIGKSFITGDKLLTLFNGSDLCNAYIPMFMYVAAGSPANNGYQHFAFMQNPNSYQIIFGDTIPIIYCPEGFMFDEDMSTANLWQYDQSCYPETFMVDTNIIRPMLDHLRQGIDSILKSTFEELTKSSEKYGQPELNYGQRYWFWNLVASRVTELMLVRKDIERLGKGQYRFDGMNFR